LTEVQIYFPEGWDAAKLRLKLAQNLPSMKIRVGVKTSTEKATEEVWKVKGQK